MELKKLTAYVENLWEKDQNKFTEILEVFRIFNSRLGRLESIIDAGGDMNNSFEADYRNGSSRSYLAEEPTTRKAIKAIEFAETNIKANTISINAIVEPNSSRPKSEKAELKASITAAEEELRMLDADKAYKKSLITNWIAEFTAKNGVEPHAKDKESIHSYYVDYKTVAKSREDCFQKLQGLRERLHRKDLLQEQMLEESENS